MMMALTVGGSAAGGSVAMIEVSDLRAESSLAKEKELILVIEFSAEDCGYCRKLEDLFSFSIE
jgi:hypothetical protein